MRVSVGCGFFGAIFLLAVTCGAWSCCQLRDCRYTCRHLCRVIYRSPGPSPCHWLMPPSLLALWASRLLSLVEGYFSQTGTHGSWDAFCFQSYTQTPPPPIPPTPPRLIFVFLLLPLSLLTCTLVRAKCEAYIEMQRLHSWKMCYLMSLRCRRYGLVSW